MDYCTWYSDGPVCTESGVESFGGVGGNGNECWPEVAAAAATAAT